MDVSGRVAVVTGAAGGIGSAIAQRLLAAGARVVLTDLDAARLDDVTARLRTRHPGVSAVAGDAADPRHIAALLAAAQDSFGPVDLYFANAGIADGAGLADEAQWDKVLQINLRAHVRAAQQLIPGWLERGTGYFVATASAAGLVTQIGSATYSVSKHAAIAFAEWLAVTYGARGVRVSCLAPMGVNTPLLFGGAQSDDPVAQRSTRAVTRAGTVLEPDEVAAAVLDGIRDERFLILPHPQVLEFFRRKADDYDRWIRGMQRYQESLS